MTIENLAAFSDQDLRSELARRKQKAAEENWQRMKAKARYTCPFCGGPDSWHERDCPSDALDTAT